MKKYNRKKQAAPPFTLTLIGKPSLYSSMWFDSMCENSIFCECRKSRQLGVIQIRGRMSSSCCLQLLGFKILYYVVLYGNLTSRGRELCKLENE